MLQNSALITPLPLREDKCRRMTCCGGYLTRNLNLSRLEKKNMINPHPRKNPSCVVALHCMDIVWLIAMNNNAAAVSTGSRCTIQICHITLPEYPGTTKPNPFPHHCRPTIPRFWGCSV